MGLRGTWDDTGHWYNRSAVLTGLNPVPVVGHGNPAQKQTLPVDQDDEAVEEEEEKETNSKEQQQTHASSSSASCSANNNALYSDTTYPINCNNRKFQYYCRDNTLLSGLHLKASNQASISVCAQCGPVVPDDPPSVLIRKESNETNKKEASTTTAHHFFDASTSTDSMTESLAPTTASRDSNDHEDAFSVRPPRAMPSTNRGAADAGTTTTSTRGKWSKFTSSGDSNHPTPGPSHPLMSPETRAALCSRTSPATGKENVTFVVDQSPMTPEQKQEWLRVQNWTWMLQNALEIEFIIIVVVLVCVFVRLILMYFFYPKSRQ